MAETQLSHKLGHDNSIFSHEVPAKVNRSDFPIGRKRDFMLDAGAIVPIDLIETNPNESFELKLRYILKTNPLVTAPFTNYIVRTHWYYARLIDLWEGAETMMTKGRDGKIELEVPTISTSRVIMQGGSDTQSENGLKQKNYGTPMSLSAYLGIKPNCWRTDTTESTLEDNPCSQSAPDQNNWNAQNGKWKLVGKNDYVSVLPFFMYQKIYRNAYLVPNLLQDNKIWFPENLNNGWRIHYNKDNIKGNWGNIAKRKGMFVPENWLESEEQDITDSTPEVAKNYISNDVPTVDDEAVNVYALRYATFEDDRFTTALPWKTRGTVPTIDLSEEGELSIDINIPHLYMDKGTIPIETNPEGTSLLSDVIIARDDHTNGKSITTVSGLPEIGSHLYANTSTLRTNPTQIRQAIPQLKTSFSINDLRAKIALTVWQERNARTQGDYNSTIYAHFNSNPHSKDYEPIYIGGTSDVLMFRDVVQTSEGDNPLGTSAGLGETSAEGNIGFFKSPDYGYIMGVMIISPETIYTDGLEKMWYRTQMEDFYMPEYESLGLEEIYNREIYISGNAEIDDALFGYNERGTEYKTRNNQALGFYAIPSTDEDNPYKDITAQVQAREFTETPKLSLQFVTMSPENMRKDWLAVPTMPAFKCTLATICRATRPMAYKSVPETFGF